MANHVTNTITLVSGNKSATRRWHEIIDVLESYEGDLSAAPFLKKKEEVSNKWMEKNVGAKWASIIDIGPSVMHVSSAWSPTIKFFEKLGKHLKKLDADVTMHMTYSDEFVNFAGACAYVEGNFKDQSQSADWFVRMRADKIGYPIDDYDPTEDEEFWNWIHEEIETWAEDLVEELES